MTVRVLLVPAATRVTLGGVGVLGIAEAGLVAVAGGSGELGAIRGVYHGAGVRRREAGAGVTILILPGREVGLTRPAEAALEHLPGQSRSQGPSPVQCHHPGQRAMLVAEAPLRRYRGLPARRRGREEAVATLAALRRPQEPHDYLAPLTHLHHHPAGDTAGVLATATAVCREAAVLAVHLLAAVVATGA